MYIGEPELVITLLVATITVTGTIGYLMFLSYKIDRLTKKINSK